MVSQARRRQNKNEHAKGGELIRQHAEAKVKHWEEEEERRRAERAEALEIRQLEQRKRFAIESGMTVEEREVGVAAGDSRQ